MIWLLRRINRRPTEFAPAVDEGTGILPGLPPVAGKPVHLAFDGGLMTSDAGILLLAPTQCYRTHTALPVCPPRRSARSVRASIDASASGSRLGEKLSLL